MRRLRLLELVLARVASCDLLVWSPIVGAALVSHPHPGIEKIKYKLSISTFVVYTKMSRWFIHNYLTDAVGAPEIVDTAPEKLLTESNTRRAAL